MRKSGSAHLGPFRWRGRLNWKDIIERVIAGLLSGMAAGAMFWLLMTMLGGG